MTPGGILGIADAAQARAVALDRGLFSQHFRRAFTQPLQRHIDLRIGGRRLAAIHGGARSINRFLFASAPDAVLAEEIAATGFEGVVARHCGIPFTRMVEGRLWHNAGATGMPAHDGTPWVWFPLLRPEAEGLRIEHHALAYDHAAAARAMRAAGLAEGYAAALETGLWPSEDVLPAAERAKRGAAVEPCTYVWPTAGGT